MDFQTQKKYRNRAIINVTSLIDVMFLLLIFFLVSSTFKTQPAISLVLPESSTAQSVQSGPAVLYLTAAGDIFLDDDPLDRDSVLPALRRKQAATGETRIILRADRSSDHGDVVGLIDLVKQSGFSQVSLSAKQVQEP